ncbi:hypothetical protein [Escherichia ruysiae]|uniref:hypothetical protein n=1 Tax=Escherichia ruysiae TaxID=2608867 RepID=UPI00215AD195|nr:hypothetical protein [Escherichia ruysiae]
MLKYKKKAAVICFLYFLFVSVVTCYLYTIYVKGRINSVKVSIVDSGLAIANVSEYRRSVSNNIFYELDIAPEELVKKYTIALLAMKILDICMISVLILLAMVNVSKLQRKGMIFVAT